MLCHSSGWMSAAGVGVELGGGAGDGRRHWRGKPVIEAYHRAPVRVRDPDPQSPAVAASLAEMISSAVPGLRAEHVGSSAVPDLAGKGTIDLLLPTPAERVAEVAEALQAMGFQPQSVPQTFPETRPMLQGVIRTAISPTGSTCTSSRTPARRSWSCGASATRCAPTGRCGATTRT